MLRIEKIIELANTPHYELLEEEKVIKMRDELIRTINRTVKEGV